MAAMLPRTITLTMGAAERLAPQRENFSQPSPAMEAAVPVEDFSERGPWYDNARTAMVLACSRGEKTGALSDRLTDEASRFLDALSRIPTAKERRQTLTTLEAMWWQHGGLRTPEGYMVRWTPNGIEDRRPPFLQRKPGP
jgi:hypothetical protein